MKRCYDGIYYAFELLEYNYNQLYFQYEQLPSLPIFLKAKLIPLLSNVWMIVDQIFKIREISQAIPGLSHLDQHRKTFLDETIITDELRHYIQHLRNKLAKKDIDTFPVFGSLSWVDPKRPNLYHTAYFGNSYEDQNGEHQSYFAGHFDAASRKWKSRICLSINGEQFNIDPLFESAKVFKNHIMLWIKMNYLKSLQESDSINVLTFNMNTNQETIFD